MTETDQNDPNPSSPQKPETVSPELLRQLRELVTTYQSVGQVEGEVYWAWALNIIEDMMEEQITSTEEADLMTTG